MLIARQGRAWSETGLSANANRGAGTGTVGDRPKREWTGPSERNIKQKMGP